LMHDWLNSLTPRINTKPHTDETYQYYKVLFTIKTLLLAMHFGLGDDKNDELKKFIREYDSTLWKRAYAS